MLEQNNNSFGICIEFLTKLRIPILIFLGLKKSNCNFYSKIFPHQKNKTKIRIRSFVRNMMQIQKMPLFFSIIHSFWLLYVYIYIEYY